MQGDPEAGVELEAHPVDIDLLRQVALERRQTARVERGFVAGGPSAHRGARGHVEHVRRAREHVARVPEHEVVHLGACLRALEQVGLVDHDRHLLAPPGDALEEAALALGEGAVGGGDEQHQIGARDELLGQQLVFGDHRVRSRRVDERERPQALGRVRDARELRRELFEGRFGAVHHERDPVGGRGHPFAHDWRAQQCVHQRRLAGVELADDHEQEEPFEVLEGGGERALRVVAQVPAGDQRPEVADRRALAQQQVGDVLVEDAAQRA